VHQLEIKVLNTGNYDLVAILHSVLECKSSIWIGKFLVICVSYILCSGYINILEFFSGVLY